MSRILRTARVLILWLLAGALPAMSADDIRLIPYPQNITKLSGRLQLGPAQCVIPHPSGTTAVASGSLSSYLPRSGSSVTVRLGSVEEGYTSSWLASEQNSFLSSSTTSSEASIVQIDADGITVVGKGKWGMLYGVQTVNQLVRGTETQQGIWQTNTSLPYLVIKDWPDMGWRCLSPQMTWYSGWNRLEGYDMGNWTLDEWKWLVDWSLLHKCNGWAYVFCGYWPFTLPGYEESTLDVDSFYYDPKTGEKTPYRFIHRNIKKEFLPELIRYAQARGIKMYAYSAINSFNGGYQLHHPEVDAGGAAEMLPFAPGVHDYCRAFLRRIVDMGFDGFIFENPEANHVPYQNDECYKTFWEPFGYTPEQAKELTNKAPLDAHLNYNAWLVHEYDTLIQEHWHALGHTDDMDFFVISHVMFGRVMADSKTPEQRADWLAKFDAVAGRKMPVITAESDEKRYVEMFGPKRTANLGGRGGSCTCAMFRIASINNNWEGGPMGADLAYERACQKHIYDAGGFGAMGYIFEWANTEVFGYIASQYLWQNSGVPGINNDDQTGFLYYAYPRHYGETVGEMVARVMDESSCVNDQMMLEGVQGAQYPSTGAPLHRDYQLLAAIADRSVEMARKAYQAYTGKEPDLWHPVYNPDDFRWDGYDPLANMTFNAERLRLLCVSTRRSQKICETAIAYRKSQRLIAEGASVGEVLECLDKAVEAAKENQRIYCLNYDDDYNWTDGLCSRVVDELELRRRQFVASISTNAKIAKAWTFDQPGDLEGWTRSNGLETPVVEDGVFVARAIGNDPIVEQTKPLSLPVNDRCFVEIEITSDHEGRFRFFWATQEDLAKQTKDAYAFTEGRVRNIPLVGGGEMRVYRISPSWHGTLANLRFDVPPGASVRVDSIRIVELPESHAVPPEDLLKPVPETVRKSADQPLFIPWENLSDVLPQDRAATKPGLYLSTEIGFDRRPDFFRVGVVFTVETQEPGGPWRPIFRRGLARRTTGWEHWDIPLRGLQGDIKLRFTTDSYSRAQNRSAPSWNWAIWGQPQLVEMTSDGKRRVRYDFIDQIDSSKVVVRLDQDGKERAFDGKGQDSTGATFAYNPGELQLLKPGEAKDWQILDGFAEWAVPPHQGQYRCYLGNVDSGWAYGKEEGEITWLTTPVPAQRNTAVAFVAGSGYAPGKVDLSCNGEKLISFDVAKAVDQQWEENGVALRFILGGDTRNETTTFGISGIYVLMLPASKVTAGKPLTLSIRTPSAGGCDWFMLHEYRSIQDEARHVMCPKPVMPAIAAFTPHVDQRFGVTVAEYEVDLGE